MGFKKSTKNNVKSMKTEKIVPITNCKYCLFSKPPLRRITWIKISRTLNKKLVVPTLKLEIRLQTYGMQIKGDVPKLALIDKDAPRDMINKEIK